MQPHDIDFETETELSVDSLGARGEGLAQGPDGRVYVPFSTPGDRIRARLRGDRAENWDLLAPSPDRVAAFCRYFGQCGGCSVQTASPRVYAEWKRDLVERALRRAGVDAPVAPLADAHGEGRRRATFHVRRDGPDLYVGFMKARSHDLIDLDACPVLAPSMDGALTAVRAIAEAAREIQKPFDALATATDTGLDLDLRGVGAISEGARRKLVAAAEAIGLARLSNHGDIIVERSAPSLTIGATRVFPPPGAFLQATRAGEEALASAVAKGVGDAKRIADLFCGVGTFALRLAERAGVLAVEMDRATLAAVARARREAPQLRALECEARDLFRRPLAGDELAAFDAVVFDPPRAGAEAQAHALAASSVPRVVAVSCAPETFARDAAILIAGGYAAAEARPVDQFRGSAHIEMTAVFTKAPQRKKRRLLG